MSKSIICQGDKIMAKTAAIKAGVPVVPGIVGKLNIEDGFDDIIAG
jgi:acetyl/propionyl-CoA carboxylase alpha subunit